MRLPSLISIALLFSAFPADSSAAATSYKLRFSGTGFGKETRTFSVVSTGNEARSTALPPANDEPISYDGVLRQKTGSLIAINSQNKTWYELDAPAPFAPRSHFLTKLGVSEDVKVQNLSLVLDPPASVDARRQRTKGRLSYQLHSTIAGAAVSARYEIRFDVVATDAVGPEHWIGRMLPVTGHRAVDEKLLSAEKTISGFPMYILVKVTRQYEGGEKMDDTAAVEVHDLQASDASHTMFKVPTGHRQQQPVIGRPGA